MLMEEVVVIIKNAKNFALSFVEQPRLTASLRHGAHCSSGTAISTSQVATQTDKSPKSGKKRT